MFRFFYFITYPITLLFLFLLLIYRKLISSALGKNCRFIPTCSQYAWESIKEFGWLYGGILTAKRLLKCRPNHEAGIDYPKLNLIGNYKWKC